MKALVNLLAPCDSQLLECIHAIAKQYRSITNCQYVYSQYFLLDQCIFVLIPDMFAYNIEHLSALL